MVSFDLAAVDALGIAVGDEAGLLGGKLREPAAVLAKGLAIARPAAVDPGIGAEQEALGMFGEQVAEIVWLLTKFDEVSLREYLARIEAAAETGAPLVKLCDRLDNMRSVVDTPSLEKKRRYIRTTEELYLPMAARTNKHLYRELRRSLEEARTQLRTVMGDVDE